MRYRGKRTEIGTSILGQKLQFHYFRAGWLSLSFSFSIMGGVTSWALPTSYIGVRMNRETRCKSLCQLCPRIKGIRSFLVTSLLQSPSVSRTQAHCRNPGECPVQDAGDASRPTGKVNSNFLRNRRARGATPAAC